MTCRHTLSLLEDYVDQELTISQRDEIDAHLAICEICQKKFHQATKLKETLSNFETIDPGQNYWDETTQLILARTAQSDIIANVGRISLEQYCSTKGAFLRSVASFIVALFVLGSAIFFGSIQTNKQQITEIKTEIILSAEILEHFNNVNEIIFTKNEQARLTRGIFLLGTPGMLGRSALVSDLLTLKEKIN